MMSECDLGLGGELLCLRRGIMCSPDVVLNDLRVCPGDVVIEVREMRFDCTCCPNLC